MSDHAAIVREGAAFYMAHKYVPNGDGTDRHVAEGCKGCAAEAALSALEQELAEANARVDTQSSMDRAYGFKERAEAAEQERDEYLQMVFADMAAENKERRSYNAQGVRMRAERAEARITELEAAYHAAVIDQTRLEAAEAEVRRLREVVRENTKWINACVEIGVFDGRASGDGARARMALNRSALAGDDT